MTAAAPARLSLEEKLLLGAIVYLVGLKLLYAFWAAPIADEAYYWMWGRHLAIGYFDHPPLLGWIQGLSHLVLGRSTLALRWTSLAALAGMAWIFYDVAQRIAGAHYRRVFLRSFVIYLAAPVFGWFCSVVFMDYLMVFLMLCSGYLFFRFFSAFEETGSGRPLHLFGAAALLGLAALSKYPGAYLGIAVLGVVLTRRSLWPLLGGWQIYAAGALAVVMQAPVLIWNLQHEFASFQFHAAGRFDGAHFTGINIKGMKAVFVDSASLFSPFLIAPIVAFFLRRQKDSFTNIGKTIGIWVFWLSTLTFLYIANFAWVMFAWNIAAYTLLMPFLGKYIDRLMLVLHMLWGGFITTILHLTFAVGPVTLLMGLPGIMEAENSYGWRELGQAVRAAQLEEGAQFLATNRYQSASQLAFELDDPSFVELSSRRTAFDDWVDWPSFEGKDAIIVVDKREHPDYWRQQFETVRKVGEVKATRFGFPMVTYELYFGDNYRQTE